MSQIKSLFPLLIGLICISCSLERTTHQLSTTACQAIGTAFLEVGSTQEDLKDIASTCTQSAGVGFAAYALLQEWEQMHSLELESLIASS